MKKFWVLCENVGFRFQEWTNNFVYLSKQLPGNFPLDPPAALSLVREDCIDMLLSVSRAPILHLAMVSLPAIICARVLGPVGGGAGGDADDGAGARGEGVSWGSTVCVFILSLVR